MPTFPPPAELLAAAKSRLLARINWSHEALAGMRAGSEPIEAFVAYLNQPPRPRYRFEYHRPAELLNYLKTNYPRWRHFDLRAADELVRMETPEAIRRRKSWSTISLRPLGDAWLATGDPQYGAAFQRFFYEDGQPQVYVAQETLMQLPAHFLLSNCPGFDAAGRIFFLDHLCRGAEYAWGSIRPQQKQSSLGPEGHNLFLHIVAIHTEFGILFPEFTQADYFGRTGWSVVEEHLRGHYKADGGARETCLGYQVGSLCEMWEHYLLARRNGWPVSKGFDQRLLRATRFLLDLMTPDGGLPSIGDGGHSPGSLTYLAAIAAAVCDDRECKWYAEYCRNLTGAESRNTPGQIPESAFWLVGMDGAENYRRLRTRHPHTASVLMGPTGYAALRQNMRPDSGYLFLAAADRGPIVTSHGHNDIFSFELHAGGVRFMGEMGHAAYGDHPARRYDQSTRAHNCLTIEGQEQVPIVTEWRWDNRVSPAIRRWISGETHDFIHGTHEGFYRYAQDQVVLHARKIFYMKQPPGAVVGSSVAAHEPSTSATRRTSTAPRGRRNIASHGPGYWVIFDWIESNQEHDYRIYFHGCVAGCMEGQSVCLGEPAGQRLAILPAISGPFTLSQDHDEGWQAYVQGAGISPQSYPCFVYGRKAASDCLIWVLVPLAPGQTAPSVQRLDVTVNNVPQEPSQATAVQINFGQVTDRLAVFHQEYDADLAFGPERGTGFLSFRRSLSNGQTALTFDHSVAEGVCGR